MEVHSDNASSVGLIQSSIFGKRCKTEDYQPASRRKQFPCSTETIFSHHLRVCNACLSPPPPPPIINPGVADFRFRNVAWWDRYLPGDVPVGKLKPSKQFCLGYHQHIPSKWKVAKEICLVEITEEADFPGVIPRHLEENVHFFF